MNPAALKTRVKDVEPGGILVVNQDAFGPNDLRKAHCDTNPLEDGSLAGYRVIAIPLTTLNREAVANAKLSPREADRCKNFFALGLVYWLYERPLEPTLRWIREKFGKKEAVLLKPTPPPSRPATTTAKRPSCCPSTIACPRRSCRRAATERSPATTPWRIGLVTAAVLADKDMLYAGYPITPASDILHHLVEPQKLPGSLHPGGGRDRGGRHGHRRVVRRPHRRDGHQRPRHLPQVGGHRSGRDDRVAVGRHRRAARRPQHRPADQDGASGPASGDVRPQRRVSRRHRGAVLHRATASRWPSRPCAWPSAT